jgi:two-component system, response regulator RegA
VAPNTTATEQWKLRRLLLVDDYEPLRRQLKHWLERRGIDVLDAADPVSAVAIGRNPVDAMVLDVMLGERPIHDVLPTLRRANPDALIVVISGTVTPQQAFDLRELGAHQLIEKPFHFPALLETINTLAVERPSRVPALKFEDLDRLRERMVANALERSSGNVSHAAKLLGTTRQDVQYWKRKYGLEGA